MNRQEIEDFYQRTEQYRADRRARESREVSELALLVLVAFAAAIVGIALLVSR